MNKTIKLFAFLAIASYAISSCKKDNDNPEENDNEVITTVQLTFTEAGNPAATPLVYSYDDADGPGGNAPVIQEIVLAPNKTYNAALTILDKTKNPVEDITEEIDGEKDEHRFYFQPSAGSNITITNLDTDDSNIPVGLISTWTTTAAATGTIQIVLRHYSEGGKAPGDLVNDSKSSTDVDVTFNTRIQ